MFNEKTEDRSYRLTHSQLQQAFLWFGFINGPTGSFFTSCLLPFYSFRWRQLLRIDKWEITRNNKSNSTRTDFIHCLLLLFVGVFLLCDGVWRSWSRPFRVYLKTGWRGLRVRISENASIINSRSSSNSNQYQTQRSWNVEYRIWHEGKIRVSVFLPAYLLVWRFCFSFLLGQQSYTIPLSTSY